MRASSPRITWVSKNSVRQPSLESCSSQLASSAALCPGTHVPCASPCAGHFLLTNLLLPKLIETAKSCGQESRIVILSSSLHAKPYPKEGIRFEALDSPKGYTPEKSYGQSKLANLLHARELAKRLKVSIVLPFLSQCKPGLAQVCWRLTEGTTG